MGNNLSRNKIEAIETVQELLERASPREIALHPVALCVQNCLDRANTEDRDVLLKAFGFPSQTRPKKRQKTQAETSHEQCPESEVPKAHSTWQGGVLHRANTEDRDVLLKAFGSPSQTRPKKRQKTQAETSHEQCPESEVPKAHSTWQDGVLRRAIREILEAEKCCALRSDLLRWKEDPDNFWHIQAQSVFTQSSQGAAGYVSSIYSALNQLGKDDHVNAARRRCILLMLMRVRDGITNNTPILQHQSQGRGAKSRALDWIAHSVSGNADRSSSDFFTTRSTLASLLLGGTKYYRIFKTLGYGYIFLLGGMDTLYLWEKKIPIDDLTLLSKQLVEHPLVTERAKSYNETASQIINAGLMKSGWSAWEAEQKAKLSTGNEYETVTTDANFFELRRPIPVDIGSGRFTTLTSLDNHLYPNQSDSAAFSHKPSGHTAADSGASNGLSAQSMREDIPSAGFSTLPRQSQDLSRLRSVQVRRKPSWSMLAPLTSGCPSNMDLVSLRLESTDDFNHGMVPNPDMSTVDISPFQMADDFNHSMVPNTDMSTVDISPFQMADDFDHGMVPNTDMSTVDLSSFQLEDLNHGA